MIIEANHHNHTHFMLLGFLVTQILYGMMHMQPAAEMLGKVICVDAEQTKVFFNRLHYQHEGD